MSPPGASINIGGGGPGVNAILVDAPMLSRAATRAPASISPVSFVAKPRLSRPACRRNMAATAAASSFRPAVPAPMNIMEPSAGVTTDPGFNAYPLGSTARSALHQNFYGFYAGGPVWIPKLYNGTTAPSSSCLRACPPLQPVQHRGTFLTPDEIAGNLNNSSPSSTRPTSERTVRQPRLQGVSPRQMHERTADGKRRLLSVQRQRAGFSERPVYTSSGLYRQVTGPLADCGPVWTGANPSATNCLTMSPPSLRRIPSPIRLSQMPTPSNPGPYIHFYRPDGTWDNDGTNAFYSRGVSNTDNRYSIRIDHQFKQLQSGLRPLYLYPVIAQRYFAFPISNPLQQVPSDESFARNVAIRLHSSLQRPTRQQLPLRLHAQPSEPLRPWCSTDYGAKYGLPHRYPDRASPALAVLAAALSGLSYGIGNACHQVDQNFSSARLTWTHGPHLFQFGGDIRRIQSTSTSRSVAGTVLKVAHVTEVEAADELVAEEMSVADGDVAGEGFVAGHLLQRI